jgi:hypothetical protein
VRPVNDEIALFNDAMALLRAHAVLLESVARVVESTDPWPTDLELWIRSQATTKDNARLAIAFRDAGSTAEKEARFIASSLSERRLDYAILGISTAASSVDSLLYHRIGLNGNGCATLPSAHVVLADVQTRFYELFPQDGVELYTPQFNAFQQWLNTHPNPWG